MARHIARDFWHEAPPETLLASPHTQDDKDTQLRTATKDGDFQQVRLSSPPHTRQVTRLLGRGANVDSRDPVTGMTAVHVAAAEGQGHVLRWLVQNGGADVKIKDGHGQTPLAVAAGRPIPACEKILHFLITEANAPVDDRDDMGDTPLHTAAASGSLEGIRLLIDDGRAEISITNNKGKTPVEIAATRKKDEYRDKIRRFLASCTVEGQAVDALAEAMSSGGAEDVRVALGGVENVCQTSAGRAAAGAAEAMELTLEAMELYTDDPTVQVAAWAVLGLSLTRPEDARRAHGKGTTKAAIDAILSESSPSTVVASALEALRGMCSSGPEMRREVLKLDAMKLFDPVTSVAEKDALVARSLLGFIRTLAAETATRNQLHSKSIPTLVLQIMEFHSGDASLQSMGCAALSNLAVNASGRDNERRVVSAGAMEAILSVLKNHPESADVHQYACSALQNITTDADNKRRAEKCGVIDAVITSMKTVGVGSPDAATAACRTMKNLAFSTTGKKEAIKQGVLPAIISIMSKYGDNSRLAEAVFFALQNIAANCDPNKIAVLEADVLEMALRAIKVHSKHKCGVGRSAAMLVWVLALNPAGQSRLTLLMPGKEFPKAASTKEGFITKVIKAASV